MLSTRCSIPLSKTLIVSRACRPAVVVFANDLDLVAEDGTGSGDESGDEDERPEETERDDEED